MKLRRAAQENVKGRRLRQDSLGFEEGDLPAHLHSGVGFWEEQDSTGSEEKVGLQASGGVGGG